MRIYSRPMMNIIFGVAMLVAISTANSGFSQSSDGSAVEQLSPPSCDSNVLFDLMSEAQEFLVFVGDAEITMNGKSSAMPLPNSGATEMGSATISIDQSGSLVIVHSEILLSTSATMVNNGAWEWEEEYGVLPLSDDWILENFGCTDGNLPRWSSEYTPYPQVQVFLELAMSDPAAIYGDVVSITRAENMVFEVKRAVTFLLN